MRKQRYPRQKTRGMKIGSIDDMRGHESCFAVTSEVEIEVNSVTVRGHLTVEPQWLVCDFFICHASKHDLIVLGSTVGS